MVSVTLLTRENPPATSLALFAKEIVELATEKIAGKDQVFFMAAQVLYASDLSDIILRIECYDTVAMIMAKNHFMDVVKKHFPDEVVTVFFVSNSPSVQYEHYDPYAENRL